MKSNQLETAAALRQKGLSYAKIADQLNLTPGKVRYHLTKASQTKAAPAQVEIISSSWLLWKGRATPLRSAEDAYYQWFLGFWDNTGNDLPPNYTGAAYAYTLAVHLYRAIQARAYALASIPFVVKDETGNPIENETDPVVGIMRAASFSIKARTEVQRMLYGVGYWLPVIAPNGGISVRVLNPLDVERQYDPAYGIVYFDQTVDGALWNRYTADQVIYFCIGDDPFNDFNAVSPTLVALDDIDLVLKMNSFLLAFFENDATPPIVLTTDQRITEQDSKLIAAQFEAEHGGLDNKHKPAVLPKGLKIERLSSPLQDLILPELDQRERERIAQVIGVPPTIAFAGSPNYAVAREEKKSFYADTIVPSAWFMADTLTEFARRVTGRRYLVEPDVNAIEALQDDMVAQAARADASLGAARISLNEARALTNQPPLEIDYFVIGGQLWPRDRLEAGELPEPAAAPGGFGSPFGFGSSSAPALTSGGPDTVEPEKASDNELSVVLTFPNDPDLIEIQNWAKQSLQGLPVDWLNPQEFHLTLLVAYDPTDAQVAAVADALEAITPPALNLRLGSVGTFDRIGNHNLHVKIRRNQDLIDLQRVVYEAAQAAGVTQVVSHHKPANFQPHISLGNSADRLRRIVYQGKVTVEPAQMVLSQMTAESDDWTPVDQYPLKSAVFHETLETLETNETPPQKQNNSVFEADPKLALAELKQYKEFLRRRQPGADFKFEHVGPAVAGFLVADLKAGKQDAFDWARSIYGRYPPHAKQELEQENDQEDDIDYATPQEFERYFAGIDSQFERQARAFLEAYRGLDARLAAVLSRGESDYNWGAYLERLGQAYLEALVGSPDDPGPLTQTFIAGMARGQDLLEQPRLPSESPVSLRQAPVKQDGINLNIVWDNVPAQAVEWARRFAAEQVRYVNQTSQDVIAANVSAWVESGQPLSDLARVIGGELDITQMTVPDGMTLGRVNWLTSPDRAWLIAQTESTQAFQRGVEQRWSDAGVRGMIWRTANDGRVCTLCKGLARIKYGTIKDGWQYKGDFYRPPAHPGCRCFSAPDI